MTPIEETDGEFKGWLTWPHEPFEHDTVGPFYFKKIDGEYVSRFRAEPRHMNMGGVMHGGCLMTFADFALFAICADELSAGDNPGYGVTVAFNCEFISGPKVGDLIEARGEVIRAGGSLIFIRGQVSANDQVALNFSGTVKRLRIRG